VPAELSTLTVLPVPAASAQPDGRREHLVRRAKALAWVGLGWHALEAAIAIGAGIAAGSIALIGFGADSLVEAFAGVIVLWRFATARAASPGAERRAQQLIAVSFYAIAIYIAVDAVRALATGEHPHVSWVGIGLSAVTLATMPPLAIAKARVAEALGSSATKSESRQTMLCTYLSGALLAGLGLNAIGGWWWADPITALIIAAVAVKEGRDSWRGESCCTANVDVAGDTPACEGDCCIGTHSKTGRRSDGRHRKRP
jgi:divalent metal cation (Fe/Co/Zn/Cd) transporter